MLWQVRIGRDGAISTRPIPARAVADPAPEFHPFIVNDGADDRHLTWASRDAAVAQRIEGEARQLYGTFIGVCDALRGETGREPQFDAPNDVRHEIVWELRPDHLSKHKLLGGMNGQHATQLLVLTGDRARAGVNLVENVALPEVENVDLNYPDRSGLQQRLAAEGFRLRWVREEQVGRRRGDGWQVVIAELNGRRVSFKRLSDQIGEDMVAVAEASQNLHAKQLQGGSPGWWLTSSTSPCGSRTGSGRRISA